MIDKISQMLVINRRINVLILDKTPFLTGCQSSMIGDLMKIVSVHYLITK